MASTSDRETRPELVRELARELRRAAHELAADGKPQAGAAYLRYAVALLPGEFGHEVMVDLAALEARYDMRIAVARLDSLLTETDSSKILAEAASALLALNPSARDERTLRIAVDAVAACDDPDLKLKLFARIAVAGVLTADAVDWCDQVVTNLRGFGTLTSGEKAALGVTAFVDLWRGRPLAEVQGIAEALFRDDWAVWLPENDAAYGLGMTALVVTDSPSYPRRSTRR